MAIPGLQLGTVGQPRVHMVGQHEIEEAEKGGQRENQGENSPRGLEKDPDKKKNLAEVADAVLLAVEVGGEEAAVDGAHGPGDGQVEKQLRERLVVVVVVVRVKHAL